MTNPLKIALGLGALTVATSAVAGTDALDLNSIGTAFNNGGGYSLGYEFQTGATGLNVTALGYYDGGSVSNLTESHNVGIYDVSGNLLGSAMVDSTNSTQSNDFAFVSSLSNAITLSANSTYYVTGSSGYTDPYEFDGVHTMGADLTFVSSVWAPGNALSNPYYHDGLPDGYLGGNFQSQATPEPASYAVMGLGVLGFAFRRRNK